MKKHQLNEWQHKHILDQDQKRPGEMKTLIVVLITASMMVIEIIAGLVFSSMALLLLGFALLMVSESIDRLINPLAIAALLAGKFFGSSWLDPAMGIVGALLVARWSFGLLKDSSAVLLDHQVQDQSADELRSCIETDSTDRIADLHFWNIGHGIYAVEVHMSPIC